MKVYCKNCKYFYSNFGFEFCNAPNNLKDNYLEESNERIETPEIKNANNNCKDYEPKIEKKKSFWDIFF